MSLSAPPTEPFTASAGYTNDQHPKQGSPIPKQETSDLKTFNRLATLKLAGGRIKDSVPEARDSQVTAYSVIYPGHRTITAKPKNLQKCPEQLISNSSRNSMSEGGRVHVGKKRRFKLTFLMLIRFVVVFLAADLVAWMMMLTVGFEEAILMCYSFHLNCIGDALLYRFLDPRYREAHREVARSVSQRLSLLNLRINDHIWKFILRLIEFI